MSSTSPTAGPYRSEQWFKNHSAWRWVGPDGSHGEWRSRTMAQADCDALNASFLAGQASREQQWIPVSEQTPDGNVWLAGPAYNDPANAEYWQRSGHYSEGKLYANDEFDPWVGYPPTHWMPAPTNPQPPQNR